MRIPLNTGAVGKHDKSRTVLRKNSGKNQHIIFGSYQGENNGYGANKQHSVGKGEGRGGKVGVMGGKVGVMGVTKILSPSVLFI